MRILLNGLAWVTVIYCAIGRAQAPEIDAVAGLWAGTTTVQNQEVHLLLRAEADGAALTVSIEGPSQGWPLLTMDDVQYDGNHLIVSNSAQAMTLTTTPSGPDRMITNYRQRELEFDMPMFRVPELDSLAREPNNVDAIVGNWQGSIRVQGRIVPLVFHVDADGTRLAAAMDSPSSGITGLAMADVRYDGGRFMLASAEGLLVYNGVMTEPDRMMGLFKRGPLLLGLTLSRVDALSAPAPTARNLPQTPKPPFPYAVEEVEFASASEGSVLTGSLTLPPVARAAAVIVSGSGQQPRDGSESGHKPYLVLADHLSRRGIAVLRYDDRGVGGSRGPLTQVTSRNFANDTSAALDYLAARPDLAGQPLGIIGHSEGGLIASMLGAERDDLAFLVLMAGPGVNGVEAMDEQNRAILETAGASPDTLNARLEVLRTLNTIMAGSGDGDVVREEATEYLSGFTDTRLVQLGLGSDRDALLRQLTGPWMRYFLAYDPAADLNRIRIPVLALYGSKDVQVVARQNAPAVRAALEAAGNRQFEIQVFPNLNHLFQTAGTGLPNEYANNQETIAPVVLEKIADWIVETASTSRQ